MEAQEVYVIQALKHGHLELHELLFINEEKRTGVMVTGSTVSQ